MTEWGRTNNNTTPVHLQVTACTSGSVTEWGWSHWALRHQVSSAAAVSGHEWSRHLAYTTYGNYTVNSATNITSNRIRHYQFIHYCSAATASTNIHAASRHSTAPVTCIRPSSSTAHPLGALPLISHCTEITNSLNYSFQSTTTLLISVPPKHSAYCIIIIIIIKDKNLKVYNDV